MIKKLTTAAALAGALIAPHHASACGGSLGVHQSVIGPDAVEKAANQYTKPGQIAILHLARARALGGARWAFYELFTTSRGMAYYSATIYSDAAHAQAAYRTDAAALRQLCATNTVADGVACTHRVAGSWVSEEVGTVDEHEFTVLSVYPTMWEAYRTTAAVSSDVAATMRASRTWCR
jgi:hypothetical protein